MNYKTLRETLQDITEAKAKNEDFAFSTKQAQAAAKRLGAKLIATIVGEDGYEGFEYHLLQKGNLFSIVSYAYGDYSGLDDDPGPNTVKDFIDQTKMGNHSGEGQFQSKQSLLSSFSLIFDNHDKQAEAFMRSKLNLKESLEHITEGTASKQAKAAAKDYMIELYGKGKVTFASGFNGHYVEHDDGKGDTYSHTFNPVTGKISREPRITSSYYGESVTNRQDITEAATPGKPETMAQKHGRMEPKGFKKRREWVVFCKEVLKDWKSGDMALNRMEMVMGEIQHISYDMGHFDTRDMSDPFDPKYINAVGRAFRKSIGKRERVGRLGMGGGFNPSMGKVTINEITEYLTAVLDFCQSEWADLDKQYGIK